MQRAGGSYSYRVAAILFLRTNESLCRHRCYSDRPAIRSTPPLWIRREHHPTFYLRTIFAVLEPNFLSPRPRPSITALMLPHVRPDQNFHLTLSSTLVTLNPSLTCEFRRASSESLSRVLMDSHFCLISYCLFRSVSLGCATVTTIGSTVTSRSIVARRTRHSHLC